MQRSRMIVGFLLLFISPHGTAQWLTEADRTALDGCTIGVAAGRVTADGRPLIWKTRDTEEPNNVVRWVEEIPHRFIGVFNAGDDSACWMGVNDHGFAILNANSTDLPGSGTGGNGQFMRAALVQCATVADFERLLDSTNITGRRTRANYAVIDTSGAAALFETGGDVYWKFGANDSTEPGYIIRTNFALHGGGSTGRTRYLRSQTIIGGLVAANNLSVRSIMQNQMRDFADAAGNPFAIPYRGRIYPGLPWGTIETSSSICGATSVSAAVVQGVLTGEPGALTTMWAMLGLPAVAVTVPYWPVGPTPPFADGPLASPLCTEANRLQAAVYTYITDPITQRQSEYLDTYRLRDENGKGIWMQMLPAEQLVFTQAGLQLKKWREHPEEIQVTEMLDTEHRMAAYALKVLQNIAMPGTTSDKSPGEPLLAQNYPNPFNAETVIEFELPVPGRVRLDLFDMLGRKITCLLDGEMEAGAHTARLNAAALASGAYWYRLDTKGRMESRMMMILR